MNNRALTLSIVMAIAAFFFVNSYVSSVEEEAKKKFGTSVLVLKASQDIKEMESINQTMLQFDLVPKNFLEPAAIVVEKTKEDQETAKTLKELAGTITLVPIKKGEQITYNKLTEPGMRTGLAPQVAPGRRAIAIPVDEISGISKLVKPGDRVDVISVIDGGGGKENRIAKTLLQDVVILSIGKYVTNNVARIVEAGSRGARDSVRSLAEDFSFSSVTLEVDPLQAQMLALITTSGDSSLRLTLRNNDDIDRVNIPSTILADVLGPDGNRVKIGKK